MEIAFILLPVTLLVFRVSSRRLVLHPVSSGGKVYGSVQDVFSTEEITKSLMITIAPFKKRLSIIPAATQRRFADKATRGRACLPGRSGSAGGSGKPGTPAATMQQFRP